MTAPITDVLSRMRWRDGSEWRGIPAWCRFYFDLGARVLDESGSESRPIVALLVPTRAFASAFIALGAVDASRHRPADDASNAERLAALMGLARDDIVTKMVAGRKVKYKFREVNDSEIVLYNAADALTERLPHSSAHMITIGGVGRDSYPSATNTRTKQSWDPAFIAGALDESDVTAYVRRDDFVALIVGRLNVLSAELEASEFSSMRNGRTHIGHIEDLIRTRKFADDALGEAFRTDVFAETARELDPSIAALEPPLVIFDSAHAFVKHANSFSTAAWIAVIDSSSDRSADAIEVLNQRYSQRISDLVSIEELELPPGVDVMSFTVPR